MTRTLVGRQYRCAPMIVTLGVALLAGCGDNGGSTPGTTSAVTPTTTASPTGTATPLVSPVPGPTGSGIKATYKVTFPDDPSVMNVEVFTQGERRTRVTYTMPGDVPPTTYSWVWDGRQVLEYFNESDSPYWTLYQAPGEHRDVYEAVTMWMTDPDSTEFARFCAKAEYLDGTESIAQRTADGYRCGPNSRSSALPDGTTVWLDNETGLLLGWDSPGEGEDGADTQAVEVILDFPIDKTTFSTQAPPDAEVKTVAPKP